MKTEPTFVFLLSFVSISVQKFSLDISTRVEALEAAMSLMNEELNERDEKIAFLEESVKNISEVAYGVWCGYKAEWKDNDSIITFDDPWNPPDIDETNLPGLEIFNRSSGVFTSPVSGTFMVTVSFLSRHFENPDYSDNYNTLSLHKNGKDIRHSIMMTSYEIHQSQGPNFFSSLLTSGGLTIMERFDKGDLITLETFSVDGDLSQINICFHLLNGWKTIDL